jgi:hypothetical protein
MDDYEAEAPGSFRTQRHYGINGPLDRFFQEKYRSERGPPDPQQFGGKDGRGYWKPIPRQRSGLTTPQAIWFCWETN